VNVAETVAEITGAGGTRWSRVHPFRDRAVLGLTALAVAVVVVTVLAWRHADRGTEDPRAVDPSVLAASEPGEPTPARQQQKKRPRSAPTASTPGWAGNGDLLPGLTGDGLSTGVPELALLITVSSREPIRTVGYQVPTSRRHPHGVVRGVGTRWSLRTTVYGNPDYARVFLQAGPSGAAITCTVQVEGRVTERRSTEGPYGATMCQG
jgi:hypothetical protein